MVTITHETFRDSSWPTGTAQVHEDTSLNSTCIKPTLSANPSSSTTGREIKTNTTHHSSKQILKEFHVAFPDPSTSRLSLLCSNIKMKFCTIPPHAEVAVQESKASSQIFLFLLDKNKSPQTRLQRAKVFAKTVNAFGYLKYNVYFTSKIFRLNYLKAKRPSKIPWSPFLSQTLKTCQLV